MDQFRLLPLRVKLYVSAVVVTGGVTLLHSALFLYARPVGSPWPILLLLTVLTGSFTVKVPSINAHLSISETFVFASVLLFGPQAGVITLLIESLVILFWMPSAGKPPHRILFNVAAPAIAIWVSAQALFLLSSIQPYSTAVQPLPQLSQLFLPLLAFAALYFVLNSWLVALAVGLESQQSPLEIWSHNFTWLSVNYLSGASLAAIIVTYRQSLEVSTLAVIVPLLLVSYLTFRTAMGRVEDSNKHLNELNRLYLSTIETLAMAIDAKDQVTHGHIRRVQAYAVGLAEQLGVRNQSLIKAIEAAALLHDMGKLAIPEYILNKPGKLTAAEFEKMKQHANIGAEILSAIDFPYPVVPIVRHHHENWDGSGYPTGLAGTEIPIGARILSVVDCFDALTSDRPYRPRLSDETALHILSERRGSMYDPLVVDTLTRVYADVAPQPVSTVPRQALREIASLAFGTVQDRDTSDQAATKDRGGRFLDGPIDHPGRDDPTEDPETMIKSLGQLIPFDTAIVYQYKVAEDELEVKYVTGESGRRPTGARSSLGRGISGWVAAHRYTISNSDPILDSEALGDTFPYPPRSCLSTPLLHDGSLVGVITLYSKTANAFVSEHEQIVRRFARAFAPMVAEPALDT